jgi:hypothetical protein
MPLILHFLELVLGEGPLLLDLADLVPQKRILTLIVVESVLGLTHLLLEFGNLAHQVSFVGFETLCDHVQLLNLLMRVLELLLRNLRLLLALKVDVALSQLLDLGVLTYADHLFVELNPQILNLLL